MMRSLFSGVSGLKSHQTRMDVIGNNIANVNTTGFKRGRAVFSISLAVGRPDLAPETPITVQGFKAEIDAEAWIVTKVSHSVSDGGYLSSIDLENLLNVETT